MGKGQVRAKGTSGGACGSAWASAWAVKAKEADKVEGPLDKDLAAVRAWAVDKADRVANSSCKK